MKILIDTNVMLDYLEKRAPFYIEADKIMEICSRNGFEGYVAAHSITNAFYILRKMSDDDCRSGLLDFLALVTVIGIDGEKLVSALTNLEFDDIETKKILKEAKFRFLLQRNFWISLRTNKISAPVIMTGADFFI